MLLTKTYMVFPIDVAHRAMEIKENVKANKSVLRISTPSLKCMKMIFTKMEDKFDTLRVEVKELMKRILSSVDEDALMAIILDDEPLIACYDIFRDAAKEMKKTLPAKEVIVISDNTASSAI
ncbi:hypothetical protein Syun_012757 [Stephania yunnanensis]|uniref:Uncharacterized protein n=1 Tax=Stephania yunnanensis TaxID=152371 RepID=A0AAP0K2D3_9MAGN